jgi:hypothetical protein
MDVKENKNERILIAFYKGDIISDFKRETDGKQIATIQFPKTSKYAGYVWYWPLDWINSNENAKKDAASSFNPDKRWIRVKPDHEFRCIKKEKNAETKKWEKVDEITLNPAELKDRMKRPFKKDEA